MAGSKNGARRSSTAAPREKTGSPSKKTTEEKASAELVIEPEAAPERERAQAAEPPPVPVFARHFPREPRLDRILALFEQGNYALVRKEAHALLDRAAEEKKPGAKPPFRTAPAEVSPSPEVRAAAQEILKRLEPDPLALYLVAIAAALLAILAGWYWTHPHDEAPPPPLVPTAPAAPAGS